MTDRYTSIITELERSAREDGIEQHLEAARELARDRIDIDTIEHMMRFMFTRQQLSALAWEAAQGSKEAALPVIR